MKNTLLASLLLASASVSATAFATDDIQVRFEGACAGTGFASIAENDIEYSDLNLDVNGSRNKAECVITTTFPGQPGLSLNISEFSAGARAIASGDQYANLSVRHRFNGQQEKTLRAETLGASQDLDVGQVAVGVSKCGEPVTLRTKISTYADGGARLIQDAANGNLTSYNFAWVRCP